MPVAAIPPAAPLPPQPTPIAEAVPAPQPQPQQQAAAAPEESVAVVTMPVVSATVTPMDPGEVASIRAASRMLDQRVDDIATAPRSAPAAQ
jgi:hypothetical protein